MVFLERELPQLIMVGSAQVVPARSLACLQDFGFREQGYKNVEEFEDESREPMEQKESLELEGEPKMERKFKV